MVHEFIVAIDGPSGVGKTTLGNALASRLGCACIDSGLIYRAFAHGVLEARVSLGDIESILQIAQMSDVKFDRDRSVLRVFVGDTDITVQLQSPEVAAATPIVAQIASVRTLAVNKLRHTNNRNGIVMTGRDVGTAIFPNAQVKFFLDAALEIRAKRRWKEELNRGRPVTLNDVQTELESRDQRDRERSASPLIIAPDAVLIDTTYLSPNVVTSKALEIIDGRLLV